MYFVAVPFFNDLLQYNNHLGGFFQVAVAKPDVGESLTFEALFPIVSSVPVLDLLGAVQDRAEELSVKIEVEQNHVLLLTRGKEGSLALE
jgi:hypothetical protein